MKLTELCEEFYNIGRELAEQTEGRQNDDQDK